MPDPPRATLGPNRGWVPWPVSGAAGRSEPHWLADEAFEVFEPHQSLAPLLGGVGGVFGTTGPLHRSAPLALGRVFGAFGISGPFETPYRISEPPPEPVFLEAPGPCERPLEGASESFEVRPFEVPFAVSESSHGQFEVSEPFEVTTEAPEPPAEFVPLQA